MGTWEEHVIPKLEGGPSEGTRTNTPLLSPLTLEYGGQDNSSSNCVMPGAFGIH